MEIKKTIIDCLRSRFHQIKQRCNNPKNKDYKNYGGRGVKCLFISANEFINYIINELKIDPRKLWIDRIDNDGCYKPGNVRLVTMAESNKNKRKKYSRYGENSASSKLTEKDIRMIIYMWRTGEFTQKEIAKIYEVYPGHISKIINRKTWKHIWRK